MGRFNGWPSAARDLGEIPEPLGGELAQQLAADEHPRSLVYVAADPTAARRGPWARTRGVQVLALTDRRLFLGVQAVPADEPRWFACAYDEVVAWELWQNLLYGHLDVYGGQAGRPVHAWLEFNTVGEDLIAQALAPLEGAALGVDMTSAARRLAGGDDLPFHFASYLRHALLGGEVVEEHLLQRAILEPYLRYWQHMTAPPTLLVATSLRLLILREDPVTRRERYGHRSFTLPRARAASLTLRDEADYMLLEYAPDLALLRVQLDPAHRPAIQRMLDALQTPEHVPHLVA